MITNFTHIQGMIIFSSKKSSTQYMALYVLLFWCTKLFPDGARVVYQ